MVKMLFVQLIEHDNYLWRVDTDICTGTIGLFTLDPLNVDNKLLTVHLHYLANLLAFVVTADNLEHGNT